MLSTHRVTGKVPLMGTLVRKMTGGVESRRPADLPWSHSEPVWRADPCYISQMTTLAHLLPRAVTRNYCATLNMK